MVAANPKKELTLDGDITNFTENVSFAVGLEDKLKLVFDEGKYKVSAVLPYEFMVKSNNTDPKRIKAHLIHLKLLAMDSRDTKPIYDLIEPVIRQDPECAHYFRMFLGQSENKVY